MARSAWRSLLAPALLLAAQAPATDFAAVLPSRALAFPRDRGSHPAFRTEWWYVTGWLSGDADESLGFQVTFFRSRPAAIAEANPSAFTPRQILIAHAALSDPRRGSLWHDQRVRRAGLGLADAATTDTDLLMEGWTLQRAGEGYRTHVEGTDFSFDLTLRETQPAMLNGAEGYSRKGPGPDAASYYYSVPHLAVTGTVRRAGHAAPVRGEAWLDHEWSSQYLDAEAAGWEWAGLNLDDGRALMAFRIRGRDGSNRWASASLRSATGELAIFAPTQVQWRALRRWRSPRTAVTYPVAWQLQVGAETFELQPLLDDQENDARLSSGTLYWEGAVRVGAAGRHEGRGYLELTGYGEPLVLR